MAGDQGVFRMNISVPRPLKARMDAAGESVNWSATAAAAFEAKLLELEQRKETGGMKEKVLERWRAADELDDSEEYQEGRKLGEEWAQATARPRELRRLEKLAHNESRYDLAGWLSIYSDGMNHGIAWDLYCDLAGVRFENADEHSMVAFWEEAVGEDGNSRVEDKHFTLGFLEGALGVWEAYQGEL
jgi:hypothetical protein